MLKNLPARPRLSPQFTHRITVVASRYNEEFVQPMVIQALQEITLLEPLSKTEVVHAPGSFEIPFLTRQVIKLSKPDAVICIGVIFQGETGHADLIAASVTEAICRISVETLTPVIHAVLLLRNEEQARERCLGNEKNRGIEAARAAVEILRVMRTITTR